jgi:hypothetical protein
MEASAFAFQTPCTDFGGWSERAGNDRRLSVKALSKRPVGLIVV